jgi:superfamily II DNA or RNA helicase
LFDLIKRTHLLVIDEAHSAVAETRQDVVDAFGQNSYASIIGITATPARSDVDETEELKKLFHKNLISLVDDAGGVIDDPLRYLQKEGYLAEVNGRILETNTTIKETKESRVNTALASDSGRNKRIIDEIKLANESKESTLVFACTKDHVLALRILCESEGIPVEHIIGDVQQSERIKILERFRRKEFYILINLDILATGIDVPNVNRLILTRPIGSPIQYSQIIGRALRGPKNGGNARNTIVNIKDNLLSYPEATMMYTAFADQFEN